MRPNTAEKNSLLGISDLLSEAFFGESSVVIRIWATSSAHFSKECLELLHHRGNGQAYHQPETGLGVAIA